MQIIVSGQIFVWHFFVPHFLVLPSSSANLHLLISSYAQILESHFFISAKIHVRISSYHKFSFPQIFVSISSYRISSSTKIFVSISLYCISSSTQIFVRISLYHKSSSMQIFGFVAMSFHDVKFLVVLRVVCGNTAPGRKPGHRRDVTQGETQIF